MYIYIIYILGFKTKDLSIFFLKIAGMFFKKSTRVSINQNILKEKEFNFYDKFWILEEIFFFLRYQRGSIPPGVEPEN